MDSMALIVVTIPIFFPIVMELGFDPIWFGVMVVLVAEMGVITPPVGVNVFVIKGIAPEIPLQVIFRGILPFLAALIIITVMLMIFPEIATLMPSLVSYQGKGEKVWWRWYDRLGSFFEKRFGKNWKEGNKDFRDKFTYYN